MRALLASVAAHEHHRALYGKFGPLGKSIGPIGLSDGAWVMPTEVGLVVAQLGNWDCSAYVTHVAKVEYLAVRVDRPNETYDDPYIIFGVTTLNPNHRGVDELVAVRKIGPLDDVSRRKVYSETTTIWEDRIVSGTGIQINIGAWDYDLGSPGEVRKAIEKKAKEYAEKGAKAIGAAFRSGEKEADLIVDSEIGNLALQLLSLGLVEVFDLGDDRIGQVNVDVPLSEIKALSTQEGYNARRIIADGLEFTHKVSVESEEGRYTVWFRVMGREVPPIPCDPQVGQ
ncbi:hypothetical protein ACFQZZ_21780 [Nocardia sp. GCM10030253]|uniref:hypothetical protein n=1 Tax=Nocardia sp. GCM10030253 TaxID=3273404 RepID=UPI003624C158